MRRRRFGGEEEAEEEGGGGGRRRGKDRGASKLGRERDVSCVKLALPLRFAGDDLKSVRLSLCRCACITLRQSAGVGGGLRQLGRSGVVRRACTRTFCCPCNIGHVQQMQALHERVAASVFTIRKRNGRYACSLMSTEIAVHNAL